MCPNYLAQGYQGLYVKQANKKKEFSEYNSAMSNWYINKTTSCLSRRKSKPIEVQSVLKEREIKLHNKKFIFVQRRGKAICLQ